MTKGFKFALLLVLLMALAVPAVARDEVDIYELSLDQNLEVPQVRSKLRGKVQQYQHDVAVDLIKHNYEVELMRDNEVVIITLPAHQLFAANDTVLTAAGQEQLRYIARYLKNPGFYKMLLVMHSDDTGTRAYSVNLTRARVNSAFDFLDKDASVDFVVPYALGDTEPLDDVPNSSMANRRQNRRLEIYLVPGEVMLEQAKKGAISINTVLRK